ncbi:MAG: MgtC/SapB family protein [Eubacteriaceae bacterium]|nr:MgtC/SapB family protein [Eubacteriaceae bacterium]
MQIDLTDIVIRITLAIVLGGIIGIERERTGKPAGLRTHVLVSVGAASVMLTGIMMFFDFKDMTQMDPSRLGAQVVSGIGFLGAGTIIRAGYDIKGLTTAASVWAVGCIGLAAGAGYYEIGIISAVSVVLALRFVHPIIFKHAVSEIYTNIEIGYQIDALPEDLYKNIKKDGYRIIRYRVHQNNLNFTIVEPDNKEDFSIFNYIDRDKIDYINIHDETGA